MDSVGILPRDSLGFFIRLDQGFGIGAETIEEPTGCHLFICLHFLYIYLLFIYYLLISFLYILDCCAFDLIFSGLVGVVCLDWEAKGRPSGGLNAVNAGT